MAIWPRSAVASVPSFTTSPLTYAGRVGPALGVDVVVHRDVATGTLSDSPPVRLFGRLLEMLPVGDVISLTHSSQPIPLLSDSVGLQHYCRRISERQRSGLVEVAVHAGAQGPCLTYFYKRLERPAFKFFGVVVSGATEGSWIWMVHTMERGVTGVSEAAVTVWLAEAGEITIDSYESSWPRGPYEPEYAGVDGSTLRYCRTLSSTLPSSPTIHRRRRGKS